MFIDLIGHSINVYVYDIIDKNKHTKEHVAYLNKTFDILRKYKMKSNLNKCIFGVGSGNS